MNNSFNIFGARQFALAIGIGISVIACAPQSTQDKATAKDVVENTQSETFDPRPLWNEFESELRLFYAYIDHGGFDYDAQLAHSKSLALKTKTDDEFRKILTRTAYTFADPHFNVGPYGDGDYNVLPTSSDLKVELANDQLVVVDVRANSAADKAGIRPGFIIEKIDDQSPLTAARAPFGDVLAGAPNAVQLSYGANLAVNGRRGSKRQIVVSTPDGSVEKNLPSPRDFAKHVQGMPKLETRKLDNIGVIRINNKLYDNEMITLFDQAIESQLETDGLILDLRNTPSGGNTEVARSIIGHFISETRSYQIHERPSLDREFTVPRRFIEQVKPRAPNYGKPVVVLGGHWTGSMGEGLVIGMDGAANAHTIVSDMGDLLGAIGQFGINGSKARPEYANESLFHIDGTPRAAFIGDVFLPSSDRDENGDDSMLNMALTYLTKR